MKPKAIGFLGGSFDPIHNGHLVPAVEVATQLQLKQLYLMPNHIAPHKSGSHCNAKQRAEMVKLALQNRPQLSIDTRELNRDTASYTIDTLKEIRAQYPNTPVCFMMGMDSLITFDSWYQWQDILSYCHLIVCARPGWKATFNKTIEQLLTAHQTSSMADLHQLPFGKIYFQKATELDISSTQIRHNIKHSISVDNLMPALVCDYIKDHQLYK